MACKCSLVFVFIKLLDGRWSCENFPQPRDGQSAYKKENSITIKVTIQIVSWLFTIENVVNFESIREMPSNDASPFYTPPTISQIYFTSLWHLRLIKMPAEAFETVFTIRQRVTLASWLCWVKFYYDKHVPVIIARARVDLLLHLISQKLSQSNFPLLIWRIAKNWNQDYAC